MDYVELYKAAKKYAEYPVKEKCKIISDTIEMHEKYLRDAFIKGAQWVMQNQNAHANNNEVDPGTYEPKYKCEACEIETERRDVKAMPKHVCGKDGGVKSEEDLLRELKAKI